jgi:hypothetical protein
MRQKAVSMAPQNEAPIQIAPNAAAMPIVVELSRMRWTARATSSPSTAGKIPWRSVMTVASTSPDSRTLPKTNRIRSANGNSASARL